MVEEEVLEDVDVVLKEHVGTTSKEMAKPGVVISKKGPFMASADGVDIVFKGKGTRGSTPYTGRSHSSHCELRDVCLHDEVKGIESNSSNGDFDRKD